MFSITNVRRRLLFAALPIAALALFLTKHFSAPKPSVVRKIEQPAKAKAPRISADQGLPATTPPVDLPVASATAPVSGPTPKSVQPARVEVSTALVAFTNWAEFYAVAAADQKPELVAKGLPLADARGQAMATLIKQDPLAAIEALLPYSLRKALPSEIAARIEHRVSGIGDLEVFGVTPSAGQVVTEPIYRKAKLANKKYRAYVYGSRKNDISRTKIRILGVGVKPANSEALLAVREDAYEVLDPAEAADLDPDRKQANCPISKNPTDSIKSEIAIDTGDKDILRLCSPAHLPRWLKTPDGALVAADRGRDGGMGGVFQNTNLNWTLGPKKFLMIRVRFQNQGEDKVYSEKDTKEWLTTMVNSLPKWSYGKMTADFACTPLILLDHDEDWYADKENNISEFTMLEEARIKAREITDSSGRHPYDTANFDFDGASFKARWGLYGGLGRVGNKGIYVKDAGAGVMLHEWGHNFGLQHANGWRPNTESPIGDGIAEGYTNQFNTMGASTNGGSYSTQDRLDLKWLLPDNANTITTSGTYDIYNPDVDSLIKDRCYALKLQKSEMDYHIEYRPSWGRTASPMKTTFGTTNGAMFLLRQDQLLLDMTPSSNNGFYDPALLVGHSFHDSSYGVTVTPLARLGTAPNDYLKVKINFSSSQTNNPPFVNKLVASTETPAVGQQVSLTVTASDPDGDSLAYAWDFGDGGNLSKEESGKNMSANNSPSQTKSWSAAGVYNVRCTVSDMKGKTFVKSLLIRVGTPTTFTISGRVTQPDGTPVQDVLVNQGVIASLAGDIYATHSTYTDANGYYSIGPLTQDDYKIYAVREGWQLSSPSSSPVSVTNNVVNFNFTATKSLEQFGITLEHWSDIIGNRVEDLTPNLSKTPNFTRLLTRTFEVEPDFADDYGQRMRGYFIPPTTGAYTFYISSYGHSALYLSTNSLAENKKQIARAENSGPYFNFYQHNWYTDSMQKSASIILNKGERYYIEALHKAGRGKDHFSVGADFPLGPNSKIMTEQFPIHAAYLRPMSSPVIPPPAPAINTVELPAGYIEVGAEGSEWICKGETDVAYGVDGKFIIKTKQTGTVIFKNEFFGDPLQGATKRGYYKPPTVPVTPPIGPSIVTVGLPAGYIEVGIEGSEWICKGETDVAYGIDGKFIIKTKQTGTVIFKNEFFGDPLQGATKRGYYKPPTVPVIPTTDPSVITVDKLPEDYILCSDENGYQTFFEKTDLAYGIGNAFTIKEKQIGTIRFDNYTFTDPAEYVRKNGYCKRSSRIFVSDLPEGFIPCVSENGSQFFSEETDLAYGEGKSFIIKLGQKGNVTFDNNTFGDPVGGVSKTGYYKLKSIPVGPQGYRFATLEWLSYELPGICDVAFGKDGAFRILKNQRGTFTYRSDKFDGGDPVPGQSKYGFYKIISASYVSRLLTNSSDGDVNGDSDFDGIPNGIEYALQTNLDGADGSVATIRGNLISFTKREIPVSNYKVNYSIEISNDLGVSDPWKELASNQDNSKIEAAMPSGAEKVFFHLRVDLVPITPE
jgi:hypothetical protein